MKSIFDNSSAVVRLDDLIRICESSFGVPVVIGDHYIFETPWENDPLLSIQNDGITAKPYQVKLVKEALEKLEAQYDKH